MGRSYTRSIPLAVELLEDRRLLAGNIISGYVFDDVNGNGLRDANEAVIANNTITLKNAAGVVVGTTTTDANGYYRFSTDSTINAAVQTQVQTVNFANGKANTISSQTINQFNPTQGILQSIEIRVDGRIVSDIKLENLDDEVSAVSGTVSGNVLVSGPGFNLNVNIAGNAAISQTLKAYDGTTDFGGVSGISLGSKTATGSNTQTLTGAGLSSYIGTGTVSLSFLAQATTQASGGGNLIANISNQGGGQVTVTYRYVKDNSLKAGNYTLVQKTQPTGFLDGRDSQAGVIIPNSFNTDTISVTLSNVDTVDNNFGEYRPASLKGYVYEDNNDNGIREATEKVFANMQIKLTGTDDRGIAVSLTGKTDANGLYQFGNLRPGQYTITQVTQPTGYKAGKITAGSLGGTTGTIRAISSITAAVGATGNDYNFGQLAIKVPSSSGGGTGKGQLLGSTPKPVVPPDPITVVNNGSGKGQLLGSTPATTAQTTSSVKPAAGVTVTAPAATTTTSTGKGALLGSTPAPVIPPDPITVVNNGSGKGQLLGSTPATTAQTASSVKPAAGITTTKPSTGLRF